MSTHPSAPCPHCRAENFAHRRTCWRCKRTLPTSFALDAQLLAARARPSSRPGGVGPPGAEEVRQSLEQAIIVGGPSEDEEPFPQGAGVFGKRLLWLLGRRSQAS